jgi:uncharacterized iron-regulated membrane protein
MRSKPAALGVPSLTAEEAVAIAQRQFPEAEFNHLHPPDKANGVYGVYEVALLQATEVQRTYGRTVVYIDRYSGDVLAVSNPDDFTAADVFYAWQFPLHSGEAFGMVGRWIVFASGLTPAVLYVTGFLLWWRKRRARERQQGRIRQSVRPDGAPEAAHLESGEPVAV